MIITGEQVEGRWVQRFEGSVQLQRGATFLAVHRVHRSMIVSGHSLCGEKKYFITENMRELADVGAKAGDN